MSNRSTSDAGLATRITSRIAQILDKLREWFDRLDVLFKIIVVCIALFGGGGLVSTISALVLGPKHTIEFDRNSRCHSGNLYWLQSEGFLPADLTLEDNAAQLSICDSAIFKARTSALASKLADKYPGCLIFDECENSLRMQLNSDAVCNDSFDGHAQFLCNGRAATKGASGENPTKVESTDNLSSCNGTFIETQSKPK